MADARFLDRANDLMEHIGGGGSLAAQIVFDQPYAAIQHEDLTFNHPRGGGPKYLTNALLGNFNDAYRSMGQFIWDQDLQTLFILEAENISEAGAANAPVEFYDLRHSGSVEVKSGTAMVYQRKARMRRLTEAEMEAKDEIRGPGWDRD